MHIYRVYNSLTLDEYKYDSDLNAFFWDGFNTDYVVDQVGDLSLFYTENIDDSDWIDTNIISEIFLYFNKNKYMDEDIRKRIINCLKSDEVIYGSEILNGIGYTSSTTHTGGQLRQIDLYIADEKARKYYSENKRYKWLSNRKLKDIEKIKDIMIKHFKGV